MLGPLKKFFSKPANSAAFTTINLLLGAGPIIIPEPFFRAGFIFSTALTLIIFLVSFNSAKYIAQAIQKIGDHQAGKSAKEVITEDNHQSFISSENNEEVGLLEQPAIKVYGHAEQFSYLYGQKWRILPVLSVSVYLFGVAISKCIMTGNVLSKMLAEVTLLGSFFFWLALFFVSGAVFAFKSIEKTKVMQSIFVGMRFVSIGLMIFGAIIIMIQNQGIQDFTPKGGNFVFNLEFAGNIFSNLIFSFMFHHSLPGISEQLTHVSQIGQFVKMAFLIAGTTMLAIPVSAVMAFGNDLVQKRIGLQDGGGGLIYYNEDFQGRLDFIYYIVSFYVFLNVAAFPIYIIVIRKNLLSMISPSVSPDTVSKTTVTFTVVLLALILSLSFALRNQIQVALSFTGGIFGCIILFLLPCMEVYKARKLFPKENSFLNSYVWMPIALSIIGALSMVFNLYETVSNLVKQ